MSIDAGTFRRLHFVRAPLAPVLALVAGLAIATMPACGPGEPPVSPDEYEPARSLNPLHNGKTVYRSYGEHHPTCFTLNKGAAGESAQTTEMQCPEGVAVMLESCPSGRLHRRIKGSGCICAPIDGEPSRVECPAP